MKTFIYPGSFDPVTNGHLDIIERSSKLCDKLIIIVMKNLNKKHMFTPDERVDFLKRATHKLDNVEVVYYDGFLIDYIKNNNLKIIIKGLRSTVDLEYEMKMAMYYKLQDPEIETIFLLSEPRFSFISSSIVRDFAENGRDIRDFVPECIVNDILKKYDKPRG